MPNLARVICLALLILTSTLWADDLDSWYWKSYGPDNTLSIYQDIIGDFSSLICRARRENGPWLAGMLNKEGNACIMLEDGAKHGLFELPLGAGFQRFQWQMSSPAFKVNAMRAASVPEDPNIYDLNQLPQVWCRFKAGDHYLPGVQLRIDQTLMCQTMDKQSSAFYEVAIHQPLFESPGLTLYVFMISVAGCVLLLAKYAR